MLTVGNVRRDLTELLDLLTEEPSELEKHLVEEVLSALADYAECEELDDLALEVLANLYHERWQKVKGGELDYTRLTAGKNLKWLNFAKKLLDHGYLVRHLDEYKRNFIKFLMPTVTNVECGVTLEYLTDIPLNQCILSEDETHLIPLEPIFSWFNEQEYFGYITPDFYRPLTEVELSRIQHAHRILENGVKDYYYWEQYQNRVLPLLNAPQPQLLLSIVYKLKELVENSCFESGFSGDYSDDENSKAKQAYEEFLGFLSELDDGARENLFAQRITHNARSATFHKIWLDAVVYEQCLTAPARSFMKLIKDYLPHLTYQNERLQREANALDRSEFKKLLIPGFELDEQICRERCNYLMGYILKHEFQVTVGTGSVISLHDASADPPKTYVNTVPKTVEQIFKALKNVSIHNNWRFALYDILENIVRPELSKERPFTRYPETHQWLQSLYNEEFWGQDRPASFTEISCLLQHLCDERKNKGSNSSVRRNYITELLSLFSALQKEPESKEGRRKLLTLCSRIKLFLGHALSRDRLEDGSKALKVIHDVAIENLLMKLSSRQTSVNYFFSTEQRAYVDEITLVQLKSQVSQDIAIGDALTIEQALLRVFAKVQEMNNSQIRFNLTLAEQWLSDLGINKDEPCISEIDEVQPQTVLVGAY